MRRACGAQAGSVACAPGGPGGGTGLARHFEAVVWWKVALEGTRDSVAGSTTPRGYKSEKSTIRPIMRVHISVKRLEKRHRIPDPPAVPTKSGRRPKDHIRCFWQKTFKTVNAWDRLSPVPAPSTLHYTQNPLWHSHSRGQPITSWHCSKVLVRAPSEQSRVHKRLERMRSREGNLLVVDTAIGTATAGASCDASTRSPQPPLRVCRPVEKGWGGNSAGSKRGRDRAGCTCSGKVRGRYRGRMQYIGAKAHLRIRSLPSCGGRF